MSGGGMPELGSKISLISKADIRYEGRLFTVDPTECTIALANVRSFGTEDRETQYPIAPQSQIYDYILFRGTDIKDIRVVNNGMPHNDPAIMQMQLPNGQQLMPHYPMQALNPPLGGYAHPFGPLGGFGGMAGMGPVSFLHNKPKQPISVIDLIAGASRSTTPIDLLTRKSPSTDMAVQVNQQNNDNRNAGHNKRNQNQQQRGGNSGNGNNGNYHPNQRDRRDSGRIDNQNQHHQPQHHNQYDNRNNHFNQRNNHQNQNNNRGWINRGNSSNNMRNRGRGRMPNNTMNQFRQPIGGGNPNKGNRPKNTIKFDQDFDFEQANNQFEEIRSKLVKLKVDEETNKTEQQVNGETDTKKDDSGNETGAGDHEHEEVDVPVCYDKTLSFFDNISCEAAQDRSKNKKTDWRQERKLNSETFGIQSARRGNYRGRGNYYNRNMNNYNGGFNRGFRPQNNFNNRNSRNNFINRTGQQNNSGLPPTKNPQNNEQQHSQHTQEEPLQSQKVQEIQPESQPQPAAVVVAVK